MRFFSNSVLNQAIEYQSKSVTVPHTTTTIWGFTKEVDLRNCSTAPDPHSQLKSTERLQRVGRRQTGEEITWDRPEALPHALTLGRRCKYLTMSLKMTTQRIAIPKSGDRVPPPDLHMRELMVVLERALIPTQEIQKERANHLLTEEGEGCSCTILLHSQSFVGQRMCILKAQWLGLYWVLPSRAIWSGLHCFAERN